MRAVITMIVSAVLNAAIKAVYIKPQVSEADSLVSEYVPLSDEARTEHAELAEVLKPTTSRLQQQGAAAGGGSGIDDLVDEEEEKFRATSIMGPLMKAFRNGGAHAYTSSRMHADIHTQMHRATTMMGPPMQGCDNGACVDPDKQRMYQAIRDWAQDYALDAKNNVRSADAETPMFERDFCNEMRAMLEGDQAEKPKLCPLVTKCRKKYAFVLALMLEPNRSTRLRTCSCMHTGMARAQTTKISAVRTTQIRRLISQRSRGMSFSQLRQATHRHQLYEQSDEKRACTESAASTPKSFGCPPFET